ncbi:MAG TPA: AbrB family transcriptional regulator [Planctomycetaceae bacterium]|jgi:antitoxin MazE|nr:AbrB family transcriptional regulator [Planctomycetaceae bacterium]
MEKALIRHGNSPAIVIDKPVLDLLQITADTKIELTTNGDSIMLAPVHDRKRQSRLQAAKQKFSTQFGDDLTKLAEQFSGVRSGR